MLNKGAAAPTENSMCKRCGREIKDGMMNVFCSSCSCGGRHLPAAFYYIFFAAYCQLRESAVKNDGWIKKYCIFEKLQLKK